MYTTKEKYTAAPLTDAMVRALRRLSRDEEWMRGYRAWLAERESKSPARAS